MSHMESIEIRCPFCGRKQSAMVWNSINVQLDPKMKEKIFQGEVNIHDCQACGKKITLVVPLSYHDVDNGFCVQYYPREILKNDGFYNQFTVDGKIAVDDLLEGFMNPIDYLVSPHIVFDLQEMINYIEFRDRLAASKKRTAPS